MTDTALATITLSSVISLALGWVLLFWLYPSYNTDRFRQSMFALRDRLFDEARGGTISFEHPAYRLLRMTINGFMRYAHRMSGLNFLFFALLVPAEVVDTTPSFPEAWQKSTASLDLDTRKRLQAIVDEMHELVVLHIVRGSPVLFALVLPTVFASVLVRYSLQRIVDILRVGRMDSAALVAGQSLAA